MERREACVLEDILCCPKCKHELVFYVDHCRCRSCNREFRIRDGKYYLREVEYGEVSNSLDKLKYSAKGFPRLYYLLLTLLSPVLHNLGSGNSTIGRDVINVDLLDYDAVSVVCDIQELPFKNDTVDGVFDIAVLEHVEDPYRVVKESYRILKEGGVIFSVVPFMQPFHASPHDYRRYSRSGIKTLHKAFETIRCGVQGGPVSGSLWVLQEFVALLLSFGIEPIRDFLYLLVMILTWPIKYLDYIFRDLPVADNIASSFYYYGKKSAKPRKNVKSAE